MNTYDNNTPYHSKDIQMFASTDPNKLASEAFLGDLKTMSNIKGCRIPSIINAKDEHGKNVLIAASDIGNEGADWGCISVAIRRSYDNGITWTPPQKVISLPAHHAPQGYNDWHAPFIIDPLMVQAADGKIIMMVDMFPECRGLHSPGWLDAGNGYLSIDGKDYLVLYDGIAKIADNQDASLGNTYTVRECGWVYDHLGNKTNYYMPQHHSNTHAFMTLGDLYYAVGEPDYLTSEPPLVPQAPSASDDIYVGNVFMSLNKPSLHNDLPKFVQKRLAGPNSETYSDYNILETDPAPLRAAITSYLWVTTSDDGGQTWSQPLDITPQIKLPADDVFLGVGPGVGITLQHQLDTTKNGRIIMPLYNITGQKNRATIVYSDDNGISWKRPTDTALINNKDESQCIELYNGTIMSFGRQEQKGDTPISLSTDAGESWSEQLTTPLHSVRCQKSIITYPIDNGLDPSSPFCYPEGLTPGKQYVISSHPTGSSEYTQFDRSDGTISLGEVLEDNTIHWIAHKYLDPQGQYDASGKDYLSNFFAYSCLCVLDNGNIGLLYEPLPTNYLAYTEFNLSWILN